MSLTICHGFLFFINANETSRIFLRLSFLLSFFFVFLLLLSKGEIMKWWKRIVFHVHLWTHLFPFVHSNQFHQRTRFGPWKQESNLSFFLFLYFLLYFSPLSGCNSMSHSNQEVDSVEKSFGTLNPNFLSGLILNRGSLHNFRSIYFKRQMKSSPDQSLFLVSHDPVVPTAPIVGSRSICSLSIFCNEITLIAIAQTDNDRLANNLIPT